MLRPTRPRPELPTDVPRAFVTRSELRERGASSRQISDAVRSGALLRARRDRYLPAGAHPHVCTAAGLGGRLDCVSLLKLFGVFVQDHSALHVQLAPDASRVPTPPPRGVVRHWRPSEAADCDVLTPIVEALSHAVRCQPRRAAIATLDSAWHLRLVGETEINEIFTRLPRRYRRLRPFLDPRAESGTETLVRLMLRSLGCVVALQVEIDGVGFVDHLVDEWLIVECDSAEHHGSWQDRLRDLRRDAAALAQGYVTIRFAAQDILSRPEWVLATLRTVLAQHRPPLVRS